MEKRVLDYWRDGYFKVSKLFLEIFKEERDIGEFLSFLITTEEYFIQVKKINEGDAFFFMPDYIEEKIGWKRTIQERCFKTLEEKDIITSTIKGIPPRKYIKINHNVINQFIKNFDNNNNKNKEKQQFVRKVQTVVQETSMTSCRKPADINKLKDNNCFLSKATAQEETSAPLSVATPIVEPKDIKPIDRAEVLLNHWNQLNIVVHKPNSQVYKKSKQAIDAILEKHSFDKIKEAMETYQDILTNSSYVLRANRAGHRVNLNEFLCGFNNFTIDYLRKSTHAIDKDVLKINSWFEECIDKEKAFTKWVLYGNDKDSIVSYRIMLRKFKEETANQEIGYKGYSQIASGVRIIKEVMKKYNERCGNPNARWWVEKLFECLKGQYGDSHRFVPGHLCSTNTKNLFMQWIKDNVAMEGIKRKSFEITGYLPDGVEEKPKHYSYDEGKGRWIPDGGKESSL